MKGSVFDFEPKTKNLIKTYNQNVKSNDFKISEDFPNTLELWDFYVFKKKLSNELTGKIFY